jgi:hypothetical protein
MVGVVIAMFFRTVSVSGCLAHYVAVARMVRDSSTDDVRDRLDHPNQQQDSGPAPAAADAATFLPSRCLPYVSP